MENKQTSIDWLIRELDLDNNSYNMRRINQAKEMEKEQILDAHIEGQRVFDNYQHTQWTTDQAENYYKETFNK